MCNNPLIFAGCAGKRTTTKTATSKTTPQKKKLEATEQKGDLLIRDLWQNETVIVYDMGVVNTYAKYHSSNTPEKCLQEAERAKKKLYLEACLQKHRNFSPFFTSVDGILGVEAAATLKRIPSLLKIKWQQPYYRTCGYVKSRIAINLVRSTHWCIRGPG